MLRQIVRRGEDAGAKAGKGAGDEIFILRLKGAYQQIAVAIEDGAVFLFPLAGVAGDQIDLQLRQGFPQRRQNIPMGAPRVTTPCSVFL